MKSFSNRFSNRNHFSKHKRKHNYKVSYNQPFYRLTISFRDLRLRNHWGLKTAASLNGISKTELLRFESYKDFPSDDVFFTMMKIYRID